MLEQASAHQRDGMRRQRHANARKPIPGGPSGMQVVVAAANHLHQESLLAVLFADGEFLLLGIRVEVQRAHFGDPDKARVGLGLGAAALVPHTLDRERSGGFVGGVNPSIQTSLSRSL